MTSIALVSPKLSVTLTSSIEILGASSTKAFRVVVQPLEPVTTTRYEPPRFTNSLPPPSNTSAISEEVIGSPFRVQTRSEEHTSELQSRPQLVCRLLLEN